MDRFDLLMLMQERHPDGVQMAARTWDSEAFEAAVTRSLDPAAAQFPGFGAYGRTPDEIQADALYNELQGVAVRHYVRQYVRGEMLTMLRLLDKVSGDGNCSVEICRGFLLPIRQLATLWSDAHPDERPIRYVAPDPDIG